MSNDTQPEIRFPGFTEDWEERKLGEVTVKIGSGKTPKGGSAVYSEKGIPLLRSQNIYNDRVNFNDIVYITKGIDDSMANSHVLKDDVLLNITGASIGRSAVYSKEHLANVNQHVCIIRPGKNVNPFFIQLNITSPKGQKEIELNQAGGGREGLNFQQIARMTFFFPNKEEQAKIGTFFKQLDDTIALHQRKLDLLKETKKGFLQKMFPKNGAKVPEIRFPGFTEDWEQRKLSEMAEVKTGFPFKNDDFIDGGDYLVITNGNIQNNSALVDGNIGNRISAVSDEIKDKYLLNYGDILVTMDGTVGRTAKVFEKNQILAQRVGRLVANTTPEFLYQWLNTGKFFGDMTKVSHGGTIKHISLSEISDFNAFVPVNEDERVKIGSLLLNIDKTITLHQRKLDLLKETKKGFLQKMFV
ncbi:restriction endonuclease subunit S [Enterococcus faecium]|nr:restriction endonuclease subunit S [Enterococcus faecium]